MVSNHLSENGKPVSEDAVQQNVLQQAQAAAAGQIELEDIEVHEAPLQEADLTTPDVGDDEVPPPAYGEQYGEIRDEKDGMGASAGVTDDGRVNIRVNQLNRRLSQVFTPALRQHLASAQDSETPPPCYIPPSLGGAEGVPPPPSLNVVIHVVGSRGDVQPFVALGKVLKETYSHRVRLATHPNFKDFVEQNGLEFFSIGGDPSQLMAFMVNNPSLIPGIRTLISGDVSQRRRDVAEYIQGCWRSCYEAGNGMASHDSIETNSKAPSHHTDSDSTARPFVADCIIANPPSFAHIHCAEKLGIPLHIMFTMPYSPTQAFPHPLANIQSSNADPQLTNYISYAMIEVLSWQGLGDVINRFRAKCLGLDPISLIWAPGMLQRLKVPHTYCWSPALIPKPKDWGSHISISGFYFLNLASDYSPAPELQAFLDDGPAPVYIGFGSIVLEDPDAMTKLIMEAAEQTGHRILLSKGWGGMGADELNISDNVFMLGNIPHDWLFKHVSCVVHHGGAGTTAAGISAGRPTLIVPFFGDQPFWGAMVARAGAGPDPIPHRELTATKLADAINFCLKPESLERAKELASKIAEERGTDIGAQSFHQHLDVDRLRCSLSPSRPAVWRIKRTQIKLSAFAACTLANANILDFRDLKLFRPQEYHTDEGPWDPISGGAAACYRAFTGMALGLAEIPSETVKPLRTSTGLSKQQSKISLPPSAGMAEAPDTSRPPPLATSSTPSRTDLSEQESQVETRSSMDTLVQSPVSPDAGSSSVVPSMPIQSGSHTDEDGRKAVRSRVETPPAKDRNLLRQSGVHTSRGFGRFAKTTIQIPMDISVGLTRGFHNFPKLWGDDTVRPQHQVNDFKSGARAAGKEFGYGFYDGVTGLVTQPWRGAQKGGAGGFITGVGKGVAGFAFKPFAGFSGILGHTMKGVHKEVQKLFGSNVQNYIIASRVAQGYEEWMQSSTEEKDKVLDLWKSTAAYQKKKGNSDATAKGVSGPVELASSKINEADTEERLTPAGSSATRPMGEFSPVGQTASNSPFPYSPTDAVSEAPPYAAELGVPTPPSGEEMLQWHPNQVADGMQVSGKAASRYEPHQQDVVEHQTREENPRQPVNDVHLAGTTRSEFEEQQKLQPGQKTAQEKTEEEIVLEYIKKQSLLEQQHRSKGKAHATESEDEADEDLQRALKMSMRGQESGTSRGPGDDPGSVQASRSD